MRYLITFILTFFFLLEWDCRIGHVLMSEGTAIEKSSY
jgi:hypothetical protein